MSAVDEADQPDSAESEGLVPSTAGGSPRPRSSNSGGLQRCAAKCSGLGVAVPFVVLALTSEFRGVLPSCRADRCCVLQMPFGW